MSRVVESVVTFRSGGSKLFGILHEPDQPAGLGIVVLVGGPQYRVGSHRMFVHIARELSAHDYPVLRFDFAGMGESEGAFPGFDRLDDDVKAAIDQLQDRYPRLDRFVLLGLCDGASAAMLYGSSDPRVAALVLLNPWVHTETGEAKAYVWHYYPRRLLQRDFWRALLSGNVEIFASLADFAAKLRRTLFGGPTKSRGSTGNFIDRMCAALGAFQGKVLVVASDNDLTAAEFTELWNKKPSWKKISQRAQFVSLSDADHTLSSVNSMQQFCDVVGEWLNNLPLSNRDG